MPQPFGPRRVVTWPACSSGTHPAALGRPGGRRRSPPAPRGPAGRGRRGRLGIGRPRRGGLDAPAAHGEGAVGHGAGPVGAVLGERDGVPPSASRRSAAVSAPRLVVELGGRLVHQEHRRPRCEDDGEGDALALAAREGRDGPVRQVARPGQVEGLAHPARDRGGGTPRLEAEGDVPADRAERLALGVLEDHPARRAIRAGAVLSVSCPPTVTRPEKRPPWKCGTSPQSARRSVDLPSPEGPPGAAPRRPRAARRRRRGRARRRPWAKSRPRRPRRSRQPPQDEGRSAEDRRDAAARATGPGSGPGRGSGRRSRARGRGERGRRRGRHGDAERQDDPLGAAVAALGSRVRGPAP